MIPCQQSRASSEREGCGRSIKYWTIRSERLYCSYIKGGGIKIGRSKEFDKVDVLHKAMLVFWEKGYEATSIPDLLEAMELSRSSLYETFVDKETLYVEALRHYKKTREYKTNLLVNASSAKAGIRHYFDYHIASAFDENLPRGCLITNATIGLDTPDEQLRTMIQDGFEELEQGIL